MSVSNPAARRYQRIGTALALGWVAAVVALSLVARARTGWVAALAASPDRIREGKVWFLLSSGMIVDRPIVISLVCFVALAALALLVCGLRGFWSAAFLGQVVATVLVYSLIGAVRWIVPAAFESVVASPDYGVSTISAAWLGSIAAVGWRGRGRSLFGKCSIALSCAAVGLFAYSVRPGIGILSSEHLVAFALGVTTAIPGIWTRLAQRCWRAPVRAVRPFVISVGHGRAWLALLAAAPAALAVAAAPTALSAFHHAIATHLRPTVTRCAVDWNTLRSAPRNTLSGQAVALASLTTVRVSVVRGFGADARPPVWVDDCRYVFVAGDKTIVITGMWRHGRVQSWTIAGEARVDAPRRGNANVRPDGRVRLHRPSRQLTLSS